MAITRDKAIKFSIIKNLGKYAKKGAMPWNKGKPFLVGEKNPMYGKHHTKKTKEKISKARKRLYKEGKLIPAMTGKHHSEETKSKLSLMKKGKPNLKLRKYRKSKEHRRKLSLSHIGKIRGPPSEQTKEKLRKAHLGKHHTEESKKKLSEGRKGEKNWNWLGGKSFEPYGIEFNEELKEKIRKRDNYECQYCHKKQSRRRLSIHHIDYNKKNNNSLNLISLCLKHHMKTNYNRKYWKKYFQMQLFIRKLFHPKNILIFNENKQLIEVNKIKNGK